MVDFTKSNISTWSILGSSGTFGVAAYELSKEDPDCAIVTSDLCFFSGLERLKQDRPHQLLNVGIAEQNMIGVAAGMAKEGMHVWATTYASFASTRVVDQVKLCMGYMKLPIHLVGLAAGFSVGILGATHMAIEDLAIMRAIPNIIVLSPADCHETMKMILAASKIEAPIYLRLSGTMRNPIVYKDQYDLTIGKANVISKRENSKGCIFATGSLVFNAKRAAEKLAEQGVLCDVYDFHTIKPIDQEILLANLDKDFFVTIEEHSVIGGLGSAIAEVIAPYFKKPKQLIIGVRDYYPHAASYSFLLEKNNLTIDGIVGQIHKFI